MDLVYWGDADGAGYRILDRVRAAHPHARSVLMDLETVKAHQGMATPEPPAAAVDEVLARLSPDESAARRFLAARDLRLEQERLSLALVFSALGALSSPVPQTASAYTGKQAPGTAAG